MKITCPVETLLTACQLCASAVAQKTTKPVLENLKAVADGEALTLVAYDMEVGIRYELPGIAVHRSGECVLPLPELVKVLRETDGADITLEATDSAIKVVAAEGKFDLPHLPVNEFPDIPAFEDEGNYHEVSAGALRTLIRRTLFAADRRDANARYATNCVLWEADGTECRLVGTDTKRLAVCSAPATVTGNVSDKPHLVPLKAVALLERNLTDDGERVRVALRPNDALFRVGRATIHTALVQGKFAPYRAILDQNRSANRLSLPGERFAARVTLAAITTDAESVRVDMAFAPGGVTMRAQGRGSSEVNLELPEYAGPTTEIAFDPKYLTEFLKSVEGESVALELTSGIKPAVFTAGDNCAYLVMPLTG